MGSASDRGFILTKSTAYVSTVKTILLRPSGSLLFPRTIRPRPCNKDLRRVAIGGLFCYRCRMNTVIDLFLYLWNSLGCFGELLGGTRPTVLG